MPTDPARFGMLRRSAAMLAIALVLSGPAASQSADSDAVSRIVEEGSQHSQVMATAQYLADVIGPRLSNSPGSRQAEAWTQKRFRDFGLSNVRKEGFDFGRGWWIERSSVRMIAPRAIQLSALPISWTPPTKGTIRAPIIVAPMTKETDFVKWHGKLAGRIVLVSPPDAARTPPTAKGFSDEDLRAMEAEKPKTYSSADRAAMLARSIAKYVRFPPALDRFLKDEGALAWVSMSHTDGKVVMSDGEGYIVGQTPLLPGVGMAVEDYRRLVRLAALGDTPTLEIENLVHFDDSDTQGYNIFGDIPGTDPGSSYVMAGAHLDSAAAADGAADDGAGVAIVTEAGRILAKMPRPKRTIRIALWGAEEQGMVGLLAYVRKYLATRGKPDATISRYEQFLSWSETWPLVPRPGWNDLSVYFNVDNGAGRIRGVYADGNLKGIPILRAWSAPFATMGVSSFPAYADSGSEHEFLQLSGLPGFQVIQDWNDYWRMHHTTMDTFDHLDAKDMQQASIVLAGYLWNAANADSPFPRNPVPQASVP